MTHRLPLVLVTALVVAAAPASAGLAGEVVTLDDVQIRFESFFDSTNGTAAVPVKATRLSGDLDQPAHLCFDWSCDLSLELALDTQREVVIWLPPWANAVNLRSASSRWGPAVQQSWATVSARSTVALVGVGADVEALTADRDGGFGLEPVRADALVDYPEAVHAFRAVVLAPGLEVSADLKQALRRFVEGGGVLVADPGVISGPAGEPVVTRKMQLLAWQSYDRRHVNAGAQPFTRAQVGAGSFLERRGDPTRLQTAVALLSATPNLSEQRVDPVDNYVRNAAGAGAAPLAPAGSMTLFTLFFGVLGVIVFARNRTRPKLLMRRSAAIALAGTLVASAGAWWFGRPAKPVNVHHYRAVTPELVEVTHGIAVRPGRGGGEIRLEAPEKRALRADVLAGSLADRAVVEHSGDGVFVRGTSEHVLTASWSEVVPGQAPALKPVYGDRVVQLTLPTGLDFHPLAVAINVGGIEYFGKVARDRSVRATPYDRHLLPGGDFDPAARALRSMAYRVDAERIYVYGKRGPDAVVWEVPR
jgi:hypothetical protein